jgi:hypothetical protein
MRRRYKWHVMKNSEADEQEKVKDAVYKTILSIEEMAEAENPTIIKDTSRNPEEKAEIFELKNRICEAMKKLPQREQDLIEAKYFYDKNIKTKPLMSGIGYKELYDYFDNKVSLKDALDKIKQNSRRYAKRQYTFFNNQFNIKWFDVNFSNFSDTIDEVCNYIDNCK